MNRLEEFLSRPKEKRGEAMLRGVESSKDRIIGLYGEEHYRKLIAKIKSGYFDEGEVVDEPTPPKEEGKSFGDYFYEIAETSFNGLAIFSILFLIVVGLLSAIIIPAIKFFLFL